MIKSNQRDKARQTCDAAKKIVDELKFGENNFFLVEPTLDQLALTFYRLGLLKECAQVWGKWDERDKSSQIDSILIQECLIDKNIDMVEELFEQKNEHGDPRISHLGYHQISKGQVARVVEWLPLVKNPNEKIDILGQIMSEIIKPDEDKYPIRGFDTSQE